MGGHWHCPQPRPDGQEGPGPPCRHSSLPAHLEGHPARLRPPALPRQSRGPPATQLSGLGALGPFSPDLFTAQEASPLTSSSFGSVRVAFSSVWKWHFVVSRNSTHFFSNPLSRASGLARAHPAKRLCALGPGIRGEPAATQAPDRSAPGAGAPCGPGSGLRSVCRLGQSLTRSRALQDKRRWRGFSQEPGVPSYINTVEKEPGSWLSFWWRECSASMSWHKP